MVRDVQSTIWGEASEDGLCVEIISRTLIQRRGD